MVLTFVRSIACKQTTLEFTYYFWQEQYVIMALVVTLHIRCVLIGFMWQKHSVQLGQNFFSQVARIDRHNYFLREFGSIPIKWLLLPNCEKLIYNECVANVLAYLSPKGPTRGYGGGLMLFFEKKKDCSAIRDKKNSLFRQTVKHKKFVNKTGKKWGYMGKKMCLFFCLRRKNVCFWLEGGKKFAQGKNP